ncbi:hypothetical protein LOAG_17466 [Loa loa]|uniref:Capsid protein n=1 Tax=Loa loa TaxID=7209 RepID=A0A1I7W057_LOALO|nr:hypothetical protein LOAG_17466 [Loa loa]EJD75374.1 hypothetical protein LOAG_17466 [Loa loa]
MSEEKEEKKEEEKDEDRKRVKRTKRDSIGMNPTRNATQRNAITYQNVRNPHYTNA